MAKRKLAEESEPIKKAIKKQLKIVEEEEIEEAITSYEKGKELENEFKNFMIRELNWEKARVTASMKGKYNSKGAGIDIIGERLDDRGKEFRMFLKYALVISFLCLGLSILCIVTEVGTGEWFLSFAIPMVLGSFVFMYFSNKYHKENAWVECKNLKSKSNINHIRKTIEEKADYIRSGDREYKFEYHYFVSANGFVENALKIAVDNGIICYVKEGDTFKKVGYWD